MCLPPQFSLEERHQAVEAPPRRFQKPHPQAFYLFKAHLVLCRQTLGPSDLVRLPLLPPCKYHHYLVARITIPIPPRKNNWWCFLGSPASR